MKLTGVGKLLSCESKVGKNGTYFQALIGGEGWGNKFYSKDFIEPNSTAEIVVLFNFEGDKLYLDTEDLKIKMAALKMKK